MPTTPRQRTDFMPRIPYDGLRGRDGDYIANPGLIDAANVALTLRRPLLLTGEPGCGKTDFAFVAAHALADPREPDAADRTASARQTAAFDPSRPLECHIRSDARARDLLYHYDAILRFTDGHHGDDEAHRRAEDARYYIELQPLGIALTSRERRVVLLDEIDKAPRDLPNDLLRELDRAEFEIAEIPMSARVRDPVRDRTGVPLQRVMICPEPRPLLVITSNVERQLPDPFLRRCVFFHIPFPDADRLLEIVRRRSRDAATSPAHDPTILDRVVRVFLAAREIPDLVKKPSTAELLDWIVALSMYERPAAREFLIGFADAVTDKGVVKHASLRWTDLPAYGCLFKLREDRDAAAACRTPA